MYVQYFDVSFFVLSEKHVWFYRYTIRDPSKDKPFELEMAWLCEESQWSHSLIPADLLKEVDANARSSQSGSNVVADGGASEETMDT